MKNVTSRAAACILLTTLVGCGDSGPTAQDIAAVYIAGPGDGEAQTYSNWKVVQCAPSGGNVAFQCDFAFRYLGNDKTASARFLKNGDKWVMSNLKR